MVCIMTDKETLNGALTASHDTHLQVIDAREDTLINRIKGWCKEYCDKLQEEEITRNRTKVTEINHFMDVQREEFEDLHIAMTEPHHLNADMSILGGLMSPL
nr:unnamed protein product [Timema californicum]